MRRVTEGGFEVAFIALHGASGEDGGVQRLLANAGVPYTGSGPTASRLAMDKPATKRLLVENRIPTPPFYVPGPCADEDTIARAADRLGWPIVVKPTGGGSSLGVTIVREPRDLAEAVAQVRQSDPCVLVEQYIPGRELTVGVFNLEALPPIEIRCDDWYDYAAKYTTGKTQYIVNPRLSMAVSRALDEAALGTYLCLECADAARVDARLGDDGIPYILEVNTIPGLTATSLLPKAARAAGIEFGQLCEMMVNDALRRRAAEDGGTLGEAKASA
jgi:D-alanine--D-alanine ligase